MYIFFIYSVYMVAILIVLVYRQWAPSYSSFAPVISSL